MGAYLPLPYVYEREGRQERAWDIYSRLLRDRIVFSVHQLMIMWPTPLLHSSYSSKWKIQRRTFMYISIHRGQCSDGMAIYDTLHFLECDVVTYCIGMAASMSTVLLAAGTPGKRFALPNSRVMIHQPRGSRWTNLGYFYCR